MSATWNIALGVLAIFSAIGFKVLAHLVSEEVEGRLDQIGYAVLRLACRRLPTKLRARYFQEWAAELDAHLLDATERPLTRLYWSLRFPGSLLFRARSVARIQDLDALKEQPGRWAQMVADRNFTLVLMFGACPTTVWMAVNNVLRADMPLLFRLFFGVMGVTLVVLEVVAILGMWLNATLKRGVAASQLRRRSADVVVASLTRAHLDTLLTDETRQSRAQS